MRVLQSPSKLCHSPIFPLKSFWLAYYLCQLFTTFIVKDWPLKVSYKHPLEKELYLMIYKSDQIKIPLQTDYC